MVSGRYDVDNQLLWLGTYNRGLVIIDGRGVYQVPRLSLAGGGASLLFDANEGTRGVLHGNGNYALLPDCWGNLFIGSYSGGIDVARPVGTAMARGLVVLSLYLKPDGSGLVAATYGNGVCEISGKGAVRELYGADVLGEKHIHVLMPGQDGQLWIGCQDAQLVEAVGDGFRYYPVYNTKTPSLLPDGRIAAGTVDGLYIVTPGQGEGALALLLAYF